MTHLSSPLIAALAAWLATTAIILILATIDRRRHRRLEAQAKRLQAQAQAAVMRHTWAKGAMGNRDDWIVFERTMENLATALDHWEQERAV